MQKKILLILLLGMVLPASKASDSDKPPLQNLVYLTSWGINSSDSSIVSLSKHDGLILAFAKWDKRGMLSASNGLISKKKLESGLPHPSYQAWTGYAYANPRTPIILSFGGQEYEAIWDLITDTNIQTEVADQLVLLMETKFPVFQRNENGTTSKLGEVELDGIDFDFEQTKRLSLEQNNAVASLAEDLRKRLPRHKLLLLTTYHVGADPEACLSDALNTKCSYRSPRPSVHHGEVLPLLESASHLFDSLNIMAYDAGRDFDYQQAVHNYANAVGRRDSLRLGFTINRQWSPDGGFVMSDEEIYQRICWSKEGGLGGVFAWALGANTENLTLNNQVKKLNTLTKCWFDQGTEN